jgi:hypothetical protein
MSDSQETVSALVAEVDDDDLDELRDEGYLRFQFDGDLIERDPIVDFEYVGETNDGEPVEDE